MTTIGVGAVFVALALLIAVVVLTSRFIDRRENGGKQDSEQAGVDASDVTEAPDGGAHLLRIALAAYGLHSFSGVAVRGPEPVSHWGTASRVAQLKRSPGKA